MSVEGADGPAGTVPGGLLTRISVASGFLTVGGPQFSEALGAGLVQNSGFPGVRVDSMYFMKCFKHGPVAAAQACFCQTSTESFWCSELFGFWNCWQGGGWLGPGSE